MPLRPHSKIRALTKRLIWLFAVLPSLWSSPGDIRLANYSFEDRLESWRAPFGSQGITLDNARAWTGKWSCRIADGGASEAGLESFEVPAEAGIKYAAYARVAVASGMPQLAIRFWSADHLLLASNSAGAERAAHDGWSTIGVKDVSPPGTAFVSVLLYSSGKNVGTAHWDDVQLSKEFTRLGVQISNGVLHSAAVGIGPHQHKLFVAVDGAPGFPAKLGVVDLDREKTIAVYPLPGAEVAHASTTASDGRIYVGAYPNGHVYRFDPDREMITDLGAPIEGEAYVHGLTSGLDGKILGGTARLRGSVFEYANGMFQRLGPAPFWSGAGYVRGLDFDEGSNRLYVGCSSPARIVEFDIRTGGQKQILPGPYQRESYVIGIDVVNGKVISRLDPTGTFVVIDRATGELDATFEGASIGVSPQLPGSTKCYFVDRTLTLCSYDTVDKSTTSTGFVAVAPYRIALVDLADDEHWPGLTVVGVGWLNGATKVFKYNPQTGKRALFDPGLPLAPMQINAIGSGPDGKIYSSGYLTGGTGIYTPLRSELARDLKGVGQSYSFTREGSYLYFGGYPDARVWRVDTAKPWAPERLFDGAPGQSRAVAAAAGEGKVFFGTIASSPGLQGALMVYDVKTGKHSIRTDIAIDQGIATVVYHDGSIYGGTTIAGQNVRPTQSAAKFFRYDITTGKVTVYDLPAIAAGVASITAAAVSPDGHIWIMGEGRLLTFDPATQKIADWGDFFPEVNYPAGVWEDAKLVFTRAGDLYGTIHYKYLFKVDMASHTISRLADTGAFGIAADDFGNVYYVDVPDTKLKIKGVEMWRYGR